MQDNFLIEVFGKNFQFLNKTMVKSQKYEFDYVALVNNTLSIPGNFKANKRNYIIITSGNRKFQGIITSVEYKRTETIIQYKPLISILDVDVYMDRNVLSGMYVEQFLALMIIQNFQSNEDDLQNIPGLSIQTSSSTEAGSLNLKDNIHNIYEIAISAFRKYEIIIDMQLDIMNKSLICSIGRREFKKKTIECDLDNILETNIVLKDDSESVNKVIIIGEYDEESENFGKILMRVFYRDKITGETTQTPSDRVDPVVFVYKLLQINEETFEEDAYQEAYDLIYQEKYDNSIKIKLCKEDPLHNVEDFSIGQTCWIIKGKQVYTTVFTGYVEDETVTLLFGLIRTEYTKNRRK